MQQQNFDTYAQSYDNHFTNSLIGKAQRLQVYQKLLLLIGLHNKSVLEINCGTGADALWLAKQAATVLATDISQGMIDVAKNKTSTNAVDFRQLPAQNISALAPNRYNIIFSNFGGLNCLTKKELTLFFNSAAKKLTENGKMSLVIMPKNTIWEQLYFLLKLDFKAAFRRKKEVVFANVEGE